MKEIQKMIENGQLNELSALLAEMNESALRNLVSDLDAVDKVFVFRLLNKSTAAGVFEDLDVDQQEIGRASCRERV